MVISSINSDLLFNKALGIHMRGNLEAALEQYRKILEEQPRHADTLHHFGLIHLQLGKVTEAILWIKQSIKVKGQQPNALSNLGYCLNLIGLSQEALAACKKAVALAPRNDGAWTNLGNAQRALGLIKDAQGSYEKALKAQPKNPRYIYNLANIFCDKEEFGKAQSLFEQSIALAARIPETHNNLAACLIKLRNAKDALKYAASAIKLKPDYAEAWDTHGNALNDLRRHEEALASYERAIELKPDYAEAWNNRGIALNKLKRREEALASYERSIELKPDYAEAWNSRGNALSDLNRLEEALANYVRAIELRPNLDFLLGDLIHTQMHICDWTDLDSRINNLRNEIVAGNKCSKPFPVLGLFDSPELQQSVAQIYAENKFKLFDQPDKIEKKPKSDKIRIGYYSADFHNHATSYLMAELFETYDRERFELIGFSFGANIADGMRRRLVGAFDKFIDASLISDRDVVKLSRNIGIDIAVDLKGYTQDSRTQIFSARSAPIQVNYLGYPGTMGAPYIDYIMADKIVIPEENRDFYTEKIIYLPHSYQVNDSKRAISNRPFTRQEVGLPDEAFVFCSFNNTYKILPAVFDSWMRALKEVNNSVLWLLEGNPSAANNLRNQAQTRGIDSDRLVFAKRMSLEEHLARHKLADLFLDTFPYNAHTTASDALWAGLPVLTRVGASFSSRVAASLLTAVGLPNLITSTQEEYELKAIELAQNPRRLLEIKRKLQDKRLSTPLFDGKLFSRHIESAYQTIYEHYQSGLPPDHIYIKP